MREKLISLKNDNKIIHGYGASTKGNVLLQFFKIEREESTKIFVDLNQTNEIKNLYEKIKEKDGGVAQLVRARDS